MPPRIVCAMAYANSKLVRLVVTLTPEERDAFSQWAQFGGKPKLSMTTAARELMRQAAAGKVHIDRAKAKASGGSDAKAKPRK